MSNSVATLVVQTELLSTQTPSSLSTFPSLLAQGEDGGADGDKGGGEQQETETVVLTSVEMVTSSTNVSQNAEYPFQCLDCGKSFKWSSRLAHHRRSHNNERPYRCNLCPKAFKGSSALLYHQRSHSGEKPYKCEDCGKAFKRSSLLQVHRSVHTGLRTFQCTYCPLTFKWSSHYQYHLRQHTGESPYPCDRCPKAFKNSSSLRRHKNVHLGVKPHVCVVCRKAFSQSTNLRQHMRIHTGERPYICDECGRSFTHSSNLALHRNSHIEGKTKCSEKMGKEASCTNIEAVLERADTADLRGVEMSISDMVELVGVPESEVEQVFLSHHVPQSSSDAIQNVLKTACSKHVQVSVEMSSGDTVTNAPLYSCGSCSEMFGTQAHLEEHQALHLHSLEPGNSCVVPTAGSLEAQGSGVSLMAPLLADFEEVVETTAVSENKQRTELIGLGSINDGNGPVRYDLLQSLTGSVNELSSDETVATVDSTTLSECAYCGKRFKNSSLLSRHVAQIHPLCPAQSRSQFNCSVCDRSFPILSSLLSHQLSHTEEQRLLAEAEAEIVCPSSLTLSLPLSSSPSGNREAAKTEGGSKNHVSLIPVTEERERQAVKPSTRASGKISRRSGGNKSSVTNSERPYHCSECGKSFKGSSGLRYHMRDHTGERPYRCTECGKSFKRSSLLSIHQRVHTGVRAFQCPYCPLTFKWSSHYQYHQRQHTGERPYVCQECGKSFKNTSCLRRHSQLHSGLRPHACSVCGKSFSQTSNLKQHERTHSGERPFQCAQCHKSFTHSSNLQLHLRTHSSRKDYKCHCCGKEFIMLSYLQRHLRTHSSGRPECVKEVGKVSKSGTGASEVPSATLTLNAAGGLGSLFSSDGKSTLMLSSSSLDIPPNTSQNYFMIQTNMGLQLIPLSNPVPMQPVRTPSPLPPQQPPPQNFLLLQCPSTNGNQPSLLLVPAASSPNALPTPSVPQPLNMVQTVPALPQILAPAQSQVTHFQPIQTQQRFILTSNSASVMTGPRTAIAKPIIGPIGSTRSVRTRRGRKPKAKKSDPQVQETYPLTDPNISTKLSDSSVIRPVLSQQVVEVPTSMSPQNSRLLDTPSVSSKIGMAAVIPPTADIYISPDVSQNISEIQKNSEPLPSEEHYVLCFEKKTEEQDKGVEMEVKVEMNEGSEEGSSYVLHFERDSDYREEENEQRGEKSYILQFKAQQGIEDSVEPDKNEMVSLNLLHNWGTDGERLEETEEGVQMKNKSFVLHFHTNTPSDDDIPPSSSYVDSPSEELGLSCHPDQALMPLSGQEVVFELGTEAKLDEETEGGGNVQMIALIEAQDGSSGTGVNFSDSGVAVGTKGEQMEGIFQLEGGEGIVIIEVSTSSLREKVEGVSLGLQHGNKEETLVPEMSGEQKNLETLSRLSTEVNGSEEFNSG